MSGRTPNRFGISAYASESTCAALQNGSIAAAGIEEWFSRVPRDSRTPRLAFRYCLEQLGLTIADVDCVAYSLPSTASALPCGISAIETLRAEMVMRPPFGMALFALTTRLRTAISTPCGSA